MGTVKFAPVSVANFFSVLAGIVLRELVRFRFWVDENRFVGLVV